MTESKLQLSPDTLIYVDKERSKLIVEIDIPREETNEYSNRVLQCPTNLKNDYWNTLTINTPNKHY
jgi:hypothetical protein